MNSSLICASHSPLLYCFKKEPEEWALLQQTFRERAEAINQFDPELVIAFGSDHFNGFFMKNMPRFCIGTKAYATNDIGGFPGQLKVPGDSAIGLFEHLVALEFDPALSNYMTVDHAFSQTIQIMLGGLQARPVIPIFINCITKPFVSFKRVRLLGQAIGSYVKKLDKRVLFLASGGMSHHPTRYYPPIEDPNDPVTAWQISGGDDPVSLTRQQWLERLEVMHHEGAEMIARGERTPAQMHLNSESDQRFLMEFKKNNLEAYDSWDQDQLVAEGGIGSMELNTWVAGAAAHRASGGSRPEVSFYGVTPEIGIATGIVHGE